MSNDFESPVKIKLLREDAKLPVRSSAKAIGADLCCLDAFTLAPGERQLIPTGLQLEIPEGWYGRVAPRSGLAVKQGIDTLAGVIDSDFRGELKVLLVNLGSDSVSIGAGERIAQLIIERASLCDFIQVEMLSDTKRGAGGFGSTGR